MTNKQTPSIEAPLDKALDVLTNKSAFSIFKLKLAFFVVAALLSIVVAVVAWFSLAPIKPTVSRERQNAAKACAESICENLYQKCGGKYRQMTCIPFYGDRSDCVFLETRNRISASGAFDVSGLPTYNRIRRRLKLSLASSDDAETALKRANKEKSEVVLCGAVRRFKELKDGVDLVVDYRLIDISEGKETLKATYDSKKTVETSEEEDVSRAQEPTTTTVKEIVYDSPASGHYDVLKRALPKKQSWLFTVCAWALTTAALPLLTFPLLVWIASKSRIGMAVAWLAFIAADIYVWLALKAPALTWGYVFATAAIAHLSASYNAGTFSLAFRRSGER